MVVGWGLAVVIATAPSPLYAHYAELTHRPWGLSALADQQLAAGVMWVPASVPWTVIALVCAYGWLDPGARRRAGCAGSPGSIDVDDEEGGATMTTLATTTDFTTGAVLSWAIPLGLVVVVLAWWGIVLTVRAFRAKQGDG